MSLRERLDTDLKNAMRNKDLMRRSLLRYLRSEIHNEEIAGQTELDDEGILGVLIKQVQQRRENIHVYGEAARQDLVDKEKAELEVIFEYMPRQLTHDEIVSIVAKAIKDIGAAGPQDMGKVMGSIMPQVRGKAEGREVSAIVSEQLRGLSG